MEYEIMCSGITTYIKYTRYYKSMVFKEIIAFLFHRAMSLHWN